MPLFGRRLFHLNEDEHSKDEQEQDQSYTIEHTGETFHSRALFEKVTNAYELERWSCECTWRAALTHKDAYQSEMETRKSLPNLVPPYFNKTVFDVVHHSVKPLDKLAEEVSILLGQGFVIGEPVQFKKRKDSTVVKGVIERIEDNDDQRKRTSERAAVQARPPSDKQMKNVKYAIRLSDEDRVISNVQPNELQRCSLLPNREKLKTFIRAYTIRLGNRADSPWVFYDDSNKDKYQIKDRLSAEIIESFRKSTIITLDEIVREQERLVRKQAEDEEASLNASKDASLANGHADDSQIILSDDEDQHPKKSPKKKVKSNPTTPKKSSQPTVVSPTKASRSSTKSKSPSKAKKQLTLHDMKFTKNANGNSNQQMLQKSSSSASVTTYNIAVPYSLLQKLDKTRRDRGIESKLFQRLILHCARTLNDKQRLRLPDEYRSLIQTKFEELELKRRLSEMTEQEKKTFLQTRQKEKQLGQKPMEDLDITSSKALPLPKPIESLLSIPSHYIGDLLVVCTFFTSCHSLFFSSLADDMSKTNQQFLRSFKHDALIQAYSTSSTPIFFNYFIELLQILMKLLFKEDEHRSSHDESNTEEEEKNIIHNDQPETEMVVNDTAIVITDDIEQVYDVKLVDIPLTPFTCPELTRLYLLKEKDENHRAILEKLASGESKDFSISEQIDLLLLLVNMITTDTELMSEYFEYLTRTMSETFRERNQLIAERRKAQEEDSKQKKLQLQNGENGKISSKKHAKTGLLLTPKSSLGTTNDENHQTSPLVADDPAGNDSGGDDDLKSVLQRRRQMVAMSKELKEKKELEAQKLHYEQKRELAIQRAEQAYQDAVLNLQFGFRIKPLGFDRYYNRYWFFKGHAGLFVEKGWIGADVNYCTQQSSSSQEVNSPRLSPAINGEKLLPKDESNQWWTYDNEATIEQFMQSLNERGIREQNLAQNLKKISPLLHAEFEQIKSNAVKAKNTSEHSQDELVSNAESSNDQPAQPAVTDIIAAFRNDLEDIETRLRHGSLGGFIVTDNFNEWQTKLKQSGERVELAELLIQLQQTVAEKYASGIFGTHEHQSKTPKSASRKKSAIPKSSAGNTHHLQIWMNDCRTCKTYSRLYVLMMIFENAIAWNKSAIGLKCKVCRRKNKDEYIVVCDQCCQGYHLECLRAYSMNQSKTSVNDLWYCPACRPLPVSKRRGGRQAASAKSKNDYYDADIYDMDADAASNASSHGRSIVDNHQEDLSDFQSEQSADDDDDQAEQIDTNEETSCSVCGVDASDENELIQCIQCRSLFHCQCHEPPLRCPPRSTTWMCTSCRNGVNNETHATSRRPPTRRQLAIKKREAKHRVVSRPRSNGARRTARKNYREADEDEDEEVQNDEESDYEVENRQQRRSTRLRPLRSANLDERSDEESDHPRPPRRRARIAKSTSSSSSPSDEEQMSIHDDEEEEEAAAAAASDTLPEDEDENGHIEVTSPSSQ